MENGREYRGSTAHFVLAALVMGAILLRVALVLILPRVIWGDEGDYLRLGRQWLAGHGFSELHYMPGYPLVVGLIDWFVGDLEWASDLAYILFGGGLLLPVFVIACRIYGTSTAYLATALLAIFPPLTVGVLYWGTMTEPLYLCLIYGGLAALLVGLEDHRVGWLATAGGLFGFAYLTRPEAIVYFSVFLLVILVTLVRRMDRPRQVWRMVGGFVLPFVLLMTPYVGYLHRHTGEWMLTGKLGVTWELSDAAQKGDWAAYERAVDRLWATPEGLQRSLVRMVLADPAHFARRVLRNIYDLLAAGRRYVYGVLPFITVALFHAPWNRQRLGHEMFLIAALAPLLAFLAFFIDVRFFAPAFPVLLLWMAHGALHLRDWLHETWQLWRGTPRFRELEKNLLRWLPVGILVLFLLGMLPVAAQDGLAASRFTHKEAGLWLRDHTPAGAQIITRYDEITWYAQRHRLRLPYGDWSSLLAYARAHGASYLVVDESDLKVLRPRLGLLLQTGALPPELTFVMRFQQPGRRTLVYRFADPQRHKIAHIGRG